MCHPDRHPPQASGLSFYASGAFTDAKYVDYASASCPVEITGQTTCDLSGRRLPGVSKWGGMTGQSEAKNRAGGDGLRVASIDPPAGALQLSFIGPAEPPDVLGSEKKEVPR